MKKLILMLTIIFISTNSLLAVEKRSNEKEINIIYMNMQGYNSMDLRNGKIDKKSIESFFNKKKYSYVIVTGLKDNHVKRVLFDIGFPYSFTKMNDKINNETALIIYPGVFSIRPKIFSPKNPTPHFDKSPVLYKIGRSFGIVVLDFEQKTKNKKNARDEKISQLKQINEILNELLEKSKLLRSQIIIAGNFGVNYRVINKYLKGFTFASKEGNYIFLNKQGGTKLLNKNNILIPDRGMDYIVSSGVDIDLIKSVSVKNNKEPNPYKSYADNIGKSLPIFLDYKIIYKQ